MAVSRREFLTGVGGAGLLYAFQLGCGREEAPVETAAVPEPPPVRSSDDPGIDYRHWLVVGSGGTVTAYTCRVEIGQGFKTALVDVLSQGMELPAERVEVVLGDTAICPPDGPTTGSAATQYVVWGFWQACSWVRGDLLRRAAERLGVEVEDLGYREGRFLDSKGEVRLAIDDLVEDRLQITEIDEDLQPDPPPGYVDRRSLNVNGEAIVTGTQVFAGDLYPEGVVYGARLGSPFHARSSRLLETDLVAAERVSGVVAVGPHRRRPFVLGASFSAVHRGLAALAPQWQTPERPQRLDNEGEIRSGAQLLATLEERGDVERTFAAADRVIEESYRTQYASQTPIETDTAVAEADGDRVTVWAGTQNPLLMRHRIAEKWKLPQANVRVVGMPVGGGFGAKAGHSAPVVAAGLAIQAGGLPVKVTLSRDEQFNLESRYKESVLIDIASAIDSSGRVSGRRIDIFQDRGFGTEDVYEVPSVRTRLYQSRLPVLHGVMRGTSYVQVCYALESHVDMVARSLSEDPLRFRSRSVTQPAFRSLLRRCAEMSGWSSEPVGVDRGRGVALCHHGGRQLGVVVAEVTVDRETGRIAVEGLWGTFDVGTVINLNTLALGVRGAMLWGLGYALFEEVELDGHRSHTHSFSDYRIARFSDTPPIDIDFLDEVAPGSPRGCGELPVIPTIGAIANAVHDAVGVRFYRLPMTPERVRTALAEV
jgi:nicotinate dehydrogenase subunit B